MLIQANALVALLALAPIIDGFQPIGASFRPTPSRPQPSPSRRPARISITGHDVSEKEDQDFKSKNSIPSLASQLRSVNYFISRRCNYACKFCFHTAKTSHHLTLEQSKLGLRLLKEAGTEKINFAGGEPFLNPKLLGELCKTCYDMGIAVSIISNGSLITSDWMDTYGQYVDVLGVSVDSFSSQTNGRIGRGEYTRKQRQQVGNWEESTDDDSYIRQIYQVRKCCTRQSIKFKMNTVVNKLNWQEDISSHVRKLEPERWKVFQVLILEGENSGLHEGELRDARPLVISDEEFWAFVDRHRRDPKLNSILIPEPNDVMQNSYLLLDEDMCFLDCSNGGKVPTESILKVGVEKALSQAGFDFEMFEERGGIYDWRKEDGQGLKP